MHWLLRSRLGVVLVFGVTLARAGRRPLYLGTGGPGAIRARNTGRTLHCTRI